MNTDDYIVEALKTGLNQAQAWDTYRKVIATCSESEFSDTWEYWARQITPSNVAAPAQGELAEAQRQIEELTIRLGQAVDEVRAATETLKRQDETLRTLDNALFVAERMLAERDESRIRYQSATGRHLRAA